MGSYSCYLGQNDSYVFFSSPYDTGITIPSGEYITKVEMDLSSTGGRWWNNASASRSMYFYIRNSNGGSGANWQGHWTNLTTITLNGNSSNYTNKSWTISSTDEGSYYSGKRVYLQGWKVNDSVDSTVSIAIDNPTNARTKLTITTAAKYTKVTAGNPIKATDRSQAGITTTAGAVISDSHFSSGTKAEASTFNSNVLGVS